MLAIMSRVERMVARGDSFLIEQILVCWADNLNSTELRVSICDAESVQEVAAYMSATVCWERIHKDLKSFRMSFP